MPDDPIDESMAALTQYFVGDSTMGDALDRVCRAALNAIQPASHCGLSMTVDGRVGTYIFSHAEVPDIDRPQYDTGDGPCVDAFRSGERVLVRNTADDERYPAFCRVARLHGVRSVLSSPMRTNGDVVGALNLYSEVEDSFDPYIDTAQVFATQAAFLLINTRAYWDARTLSENLEQAMLSRAVIEQAKGIIISATGMDADAAFRILVQQSQDENVKLRDIAAEVVRRAQRRSRDGN